MCMCVCFWSRCGVGRGTVAVRRGTVRGRGGAERAEREGELGLFLLAAWLVGYLISFLTALCLLSYTGLRLGDGFCERTVYLFLEGTGEPD